MQRLIENAVVANLVQRPLKVIEGIQLKQNSEKSDLSCIFEHRVHEVHEQYVHNVICAAFEKLDNNRVPARNADVFHQICAFFLHIQDYQVQRFNQVVLGQAEVVCDLKN